MLEMEKELLERKNTVACYQHKDGGTHRRIQLDCLILGL